jgi:hypothetical protein
VEGEHGSSIIFCFVLGFGFYFLWVVVSFAQMFPPIFDEMKGVCLGWGGLQLMFVTAASHRSEKFFPNPDKFDPSRFEGGSPPQPYTYYPFGGGARLCLGYEFARVEMLIFIHYVVLNYEFEMIEPGEKISRHPSFPKFEKSCQIRIRKRQVV